MKQLMILIAVALAFVGCNQSQKNEEEVSKPKCLVLYYSQTGVTEKVAQEIATLLDVEAVSFDVEQPYDGTFLETIERCQQEMHTDSLSELKPLSVDVDDYDVIFLGYPIWFGTYARPVMALLEVSDFEGKTIVPFCTFGSGGLESSVSELRAACPEADVADGYGVRASRIDKAPAEIKQYLINNGYLEGEKEEITDYSPQHPISDDERKIFDAACGDYPMPIGTPVSVGTKTTTNSKDYLFTVTSVGREGEEVQAFVYITCVDSENPEFTKVVR